MKKNTLSAGFIYVLGLSGLLMSTHVAAQNAQRVITHVEKKSDTLEVKTNDGTYVFKPYSSSILETTFIPLGDAQTLLSHAVVLTPEHIHTQLTSSATAIDYVAADLRVHIQKAPFQISYSYKINH